MSTAQSLEIKPQTAPGKSCGNCTLCCKVYAVPPIDNKPAGVWCKHCTPGKGCGIWKSRPEFCQDFQCLWIQDPRLGPEWKPDVSKFLMNIVMDGKRIMVIADQGAPYSWRREPYYSIFKTKSLEMLEGQVTIMIIAGNKKYLMMPEGEILLGGANDYVNFDVGKRNTPNGPRWDIQIVEHRKA
jgi:hypothetical protein